MSHSVTVKHSMSWPVQLGFREEFAPFLVLLIPWRAWEDTRSQLCVRIWCAFVNLGCGLFLPDFVLSCPVLSSGRKLRISGAPSVLPSRHCHRRVVMLDVRWLVGSSKRCQRLPANNCRMTEEDEGNETEDATRHLPHHYWTAKIV